MRRVGCKADYGVNAPGGNWRVTRWYEYERVMIFWRKKDVNPGLVVQELKVKFGAMPRLIKRQGATTARLGRLPRCCTLT